MSVVISKEKIIGKAVGLVLLRDLLGESRWWSTEELADRLNCSVRTVQRWLYEVELIGCAVETAGRGNSPRYRGMRR